MEPYVVVPARLEETARELTRAGERLAGLARRLAGTSPTITGSTGLADALDDVSREWKHGLHQLGQAAEVTGAQLVEAARAYRAVDRAVEQACS